MNTVKFPDHLGKKYPSLAQIFKQNWDIPLSEYASQLYQKTPVPIESDLIHSFEDEWRDAGYTDEQIKTALRQLEETPVIQTSHHVTPTNGPGFLCIDLISLAGLSSFDCYLVGANSGVSFSNTAWSGALSYGDLPTAELLEQSSASYSQARRSAKERHRHGETSARISLIPSNQRDQLVYGTKIGPYQLKLFSDFSQSLKTIQTPRERGEAYSQWAITTCMNIQNRVFNTANIFYFDINRVIKRYLLKVLEADKEHLIKQLFFSKELSKIVQETFQSLSPFLGTYRGKKSEKVDRLRWERHQLIGSKQIYEIDSVETLHHLIKEDRICPGLFLVFLVLRFLNGIRCLGSFNQVEYLEVYRQKWIGLNLKWNLDLDPDCPNVLTTGRLSIKKKPIWPLDLYLKKQRLSIKDFENWKMSQFWSPIVTQLSK